MCNYLKLSFLALVMSCLMFNCVSCSLENEPCYSCNPETEAWTKANVQNYSNASRNEIVVLPISRQKAMFRALSGEQKVNLWHGKLSYIFDDDRLSTEEKEELKTLISYLQPHHYNTKKGLREIQQYYLDWENNMRIVYNWDDSKLFLYTYTWMTDTELKKAIINDGIYSLRTSTRSEEITDCECRYDSECNYDPDGDICNSSIPCELKSGCGGLGAFNCDGMCRKS